MENKHNKQQIIKNVISAMDKSGRYGRGEPKVLWVGRGGWWRHRLKFYRVVKVEKVTFEQRLK